MLGFQRLDVYRCAVRFLAVGVVVDAKPEAVRFYERYGFLSLEVVGGGLGDRPQPLPMFLELGAIPASAKDDDE